MYPHSKSYQFSVPYIFQKKTSTFSVIGFQWLLSYWSEHHICFYWDICHVIYKLKWFKLYSSILIPFPFFTYVTQGTVIEYWFKNCALFIGFICKKGIFIAKIVLNVIFDLFSYQMNRVKNILHTIFPQLSCWGGPPAIKCQSIFLCHKK